MDVQAILLHTPVPAHLLSFLSSYLFDAAGAPLLYSTSFDIDGPFVALELFHNHGNKERMKVRIPLQLVLSTAQMSQEEKNRIGFL